MAPHTHWQDLVNFPLRYFAENLDLISYLPQKEKKSLESS